MLENDLTFYSKWLFIQTVGGPILFPGDFCMPFIIGLLYKPPVGLNTNYTETQSKYMK